MRAVVRHRYGSVDDVEVVDLDPPTPSAGEVLVDVHAAATNPLDWHVLSGTPYFLRLSAGVRAPKQIVLGADFAGVVRQVGPEVDGFEVGDRVFGETSAAFAEQLVAKAHAIAPCPTNVDMTEAAAIPVAGLTALQGLRDKAEVKQGERVLVIGASGGVGTFAVQIAVALGASVTGVCSAANADLVADLGAERVIDYRATPVEAWGDDFDVIIDNVGTYPLRTCRRRLTRKGRYILIGGPKDGAVLGPIAPFLEMMAMKPFVPQTMITFVAEAKSDDLRTLATMVEAGQVRPVIDRNFDLEDTAQALRHLTTWRSKGKSVIAIGSRSDTVSERVDAGVDQTETG